MNKRIKELAEQATSLYQTMEGEWEEDFDKQRFAELIVRECLSIVKSNTSGPAGEHDYSYTDEKYAADSRAETIYKDIANHFGVEE